MRYKILSIIDLVYNKSYRNTVSSQLASRSDLVALLHYLIHSILMLGNVAKKSSNLIQL